mgnify:CR=1 FL=1
MCPPIVRNVMNVSAGPAMRRCFRVQQHSTCMYIISSPNVYAMWKPTRPMSARVQDAATAGSSEGGV